jgi:hypothetical protein
VASAVISYRKKGFNAYPILWQQAIKD